MKVFLISFIDKTTSTLKILSINIKIKSGKMLFGRIKIGLEIPDAP
ncbi:MAG: hypothetical protein GDA51_13805 [Ekhidna sp.]|nr:hypothetical protein [Ekhidna sp.]